MKDLRIVTFLVIIVLVLVGCAEDDSPGDGDVLEVTDGSTTKTYSPEDLKELPATNATFEDVEYTGVQLAVLLEDAGFDPANLRVVKATATDGFSANYEPELFTKDDTLVAYQQANGDALSDDDGTFRMVLPEQEGQLNPRQLARIEVTK
jgi:DMSO/TMAO reductase YedYZ molybdopterin-dependent catalytic subunit